MTVLYMNDYDIQIERRWAESEGWMVTVEACDIVDRLRIWANNNSDGWHSWPKPCRAARQLQERIQEQGRKARGSHYPQVYDMAFAERDAALRPIKSFLTRENISPADKSWILTGERYAAVAP